MYVLMYVLIFYIWLSRSISKNVSKKRLQRRCFSVNIAKFLRTPILRTIFKRMLLIVRKYAVNDILQLLYEQPSTSIHNTSMKIENSCQILEKGIRNKVVDIGSFLIVPPKGKVQWILLLRICSNEFSDFFCINIGDNMGLKKTRTKCFKKISIYLKTEK